MRLEDKLNEQEKTIKRLQEEIQHYSGELTSQINQFNKLIKMVNPPAYTYVDKGWLHIHHKLDYAYNGELKSIILSKNYLTAVKILEETSTKIILRYIDGPLPFYNYKKIIKETGQIMDVTDIIDKNRYEGNKNE